MERVQAKPTVERQSDDVFHALGDGGSEPISIGDDDRVLELHYEVTIEHWVRDDRGRLSRFRWFVWDWLGIGEPPLRAETATAEEVTTVTGAESVVVMHDLPYRRLVGVVRRNALGIRSAKALASSQDQSA